MKLAVALLALGCALCVVLAQEDLVKIQTGYVRGLISPVSRRFLSIPYAEPPLDALRWAPPQPAPSWEGVYNATEFKPGCAQKCDLPPGTCPEKVSEDCLYLNVYTPRLEKITRPLPTMVWIHGGRYEQAAATTIPFDGTPLVNSTGLIIVTLNYRLGALGFAAIQGSLAGNYGFLDQRLALQWVQQNIAAFGGDPKQVTLFGQSAGGTSVVTHLMSKGSWGTYARAIVQSVPLELPLKPINDAYDLGARLAKKLKCAPNDLACLKTKTMDEIITAQQSVESHLYLLKPIEVFFPWTPVVDGINILEQPLTAFAGGRYNQVPMMLGALTEEAWMFIFGVYSSRMSTAVYTGLLFGIFHTKAVSVLKQYPPSIWSGDKRPTLTSMANDYIFFCPTRNATMNIAKRTSPLWTYAFNQSFSFPAWGPDFAFCNGHVCHGSELPYLFNTAQLLGYKFTPQEAELAQVMSNYWANFAISGNPNVGPFKTPVTWPQYNSTNNYSSLDMSPPNYRIVSDALVSQNCNFWDSIGYRKGWAMFDPHLILKMKMDAGIATNEELQLTDD